MRFQVRQPKHKQGVAQLEECRRRKPEAAGSCPATLTNNDGDCGVVVCIARCERAGPGSKPGDRPIVSPQLTGISGYLAVSETAASAFESQVGDQISRGSRKSAALPCKHRKPGALPGFSTKHCRREGWRPRRFHKPHSLGSIPRPATTPHSGHFFSVFRVWNFPVVTVRSCNHDACGHSTRIQRSRSCTKQDGNN